MIKSKGDDSVVERGTQQLTTTEAERVGKNRKGARVAGTQAPFAGRNSWQDLHNQRRRVKHWKMKGVSSRDVEKGTNRLEEGEPNAGLKFGENRLMTS